LIGKLAASATDRPVAAKPVAAPPFGNPLSATVDLSFALPNESGRLIPGQRLGVTLPLKDAAESLTVPWSAVVFDVNGGTWVYENTAVRTYTRRRVVVRYVVGSDAVLEHWNWPGTRVVAEGAQELFGAETGSGK
jgi:multidrug efflux pump subunit AcrA (membrane-fusion protein)